MFFPYDSDYHYNLKLYVSKMIDNVTKAVQELESSISLFRS